METAAIIVGAWFGACGAGVAGWSAFCARARRQANPQPAARRAGPLTSMFSTKAQAAKPGRA